MKVSIDDLVEIISLLLSRLKEAKGNEIELKNDFYWEISSDELYNPYEQPKTISLGQLSDQLKEIMRLQSSNNEIMYDLKRVAKVLEALSVENSIAF